MWFIVQKKHFSKLRIHAAHNGAAQSIHAAIGRTTKSPFALKALISHKEQNKDVEK